MKNENKFLHLQSHLLRIVTEQENRIQDTFNSFLWEKEMEFLLSLINKQHVNNNWLAETF